MRFMEVEGVGIASGGQMWLLKTRAPFRMTSHDAPGGGSSGVRDLFAPSRAQPHDGM